MARQIDFTDGFSSASAPTTIGTIASGMVSYANDAAFVAAEGTATDGDAYYNTTDDTFHCYTDGAWTAFLTEADIQTAINKSLQDSTTNLVDNSDATKKAKFQLSGISTGTTREITLIDADMTMVGLTNTQTLTNKTLTSPVLATPALSSYSDLTEIATPGSPSASTLRIYAKSDDKLYRKTSAGVETEIGGAGSIVTGIDQMYNIRIGSAANVTDGTATHSSFASYTQADGDRILLLSGYTGTENVTISKRVFMTGMGYESRIDGTITFTNASDNSHVSNIRSTGNITLNSGADGIFISNIFLAATKTFTDNGSGNLLTAIQL